MFWLEDRIDKFLEQNPEFAVRLWNAFVADEDNGALHTGRRIEPMQNWHDIITEQTELKALEIGVKNAAFFSGDRYFWFINDDEQEPDMFESFDVLYDDYRHELAELIAEHRVQILENCSHLRSDFLKLLEPTFANKYMEVFGIDVIENEICPQGCGFNLGCDDGLKCEQCRNAFWNSPYEREYNLKH